MYLCMCLLYMHVCLLLCVCLCAVCVVGTCMSLLYVCGDVIMTCDYISSLYLTQTGNLGDLLFQIDELSDIYM